MKQLIEHRLEVAEYNLDAVKSQPFPHWETIRTLEVRIQELKDILKELERVEPVNDPIDLIPLSKGGVLTDEAAKRVWETVEKNNMRTIPQPIEKLFELDKGVGVYVKSKDGSIQYAVTTLFGGFLILKVGAAALMQGAIKGQFTHFLIAEVPNF
ncbi:hypothetical protein QT327_10675 [Olivibacter sp. 47]|uniref:hypothetical protein n=1 Tax=Olivibacter sp. 47 TaxID=3056486 RepID=UPI0025A3CBB8|nr:hypothetical protein [Olivibacter sp. 47]MDM8174814.1 hypothetical protein [Olivibacter sp. 47]